MESDFDNDTENDKSILAFLALSMFVLRKPVSNDIEG